MAEVTQRGEFVLRGDDKKSREDVTRPWSVKDVSEGEEMDSEDRLLVLIVSLKASSLFSTFIFMLTEHSLFSKVTDLPLPLQRASKMCSNKLGLIMDPDPLLRRNKCEKSDLFHFAT